jgi:hypothetical protein
MDPVEQHVEDAKRVLYNLDPVDKSIASRSNLYEMYKKNAIKYANAKSNYAVAYAKAQSDPAALQAWPMTGTTYQQAVDSAWDHWMSAGKNKVERALAIIKSHPKNSSR